MSQLTIDHEFAEKLSEKEKLPAIEWLAEQMPGGFFIYRADESQEVLYINQSTCMIFGCETIEEFRALTGNTFRGMVHPEDFDTIQNSIDEQIADHANNYMDYVVYRIIRKDGVVRWVDDYGHYTTLPGFGDVYYVFISDITDNRLVKEEQERNRLLAESLEEARRANSAKTAFLSNMSHEIRTPISSILGLNELIRRESNDPAILDYSEKIRRAGESLLGIISDILDFSKIEAGKMELSPSEYPIPDHVQDLYNLIRFRTEAKGLGLSFRIDPNIPMRLIGDDIRIKQIITNLLTNAVKYTEKGRIVFSMTLQSIEDRSTVIRFSVKDTGIGIHEDEMHRLFQAFDRLDTIRTHSIEGSGLGLAIASQMLALMDSHLEVESEYGRGSEFSFALRQGIADPTPIGEIDPLAPSAPRPVDYNDHSYLRAEGASLLVVDDTPMNLQVLTGLLKRTGISIDTAASGAECIEKFGRKHYDLVFLDYRMPGMDGIETLHRLRTRFPEKTAATPIISFTANAVSGDRERMLSQGFTDYMTKPVKIQELENIMARYLPAELQQEPDPLQQTVDETEPGITRIPAALSHIDLLDTETGIEYCGDADSYLFALELYARSVDDKAAQLEQNLADRDIDSFVINIHSLKCTSLAIGSEPLYKRAGLLEEAGGEEDYTTIHRELPPLLAMYRSIRKPLLEALETPGSKPLSRG